MQRDGDLFTIVVPAAAMPFFGRQQPLRDGAWQLKLQFAGQADSQELITPVYDHSRLTEADSERRQFVPKLYRFTTTDYDTPLLTVNAALKLAEHGRIQRRVLRDIDWELHHGEHWAVFGANGAGKTSFLRLLYGDLAPAFVP